MSLSSNPQAKAEWKLSSMLSFPPPVEPEPLLGTRIEARQFIDALDRAAIERIARGHGLSTKRVRTRLVGISYKSPIAIARIAADALRTAA